MSFVQVNKDEPLHFANAEFLDRRIYDVFIGQGSSIRLGYGSHAETTGICFCEP